MSISKTLKALLRGKSGLFLTFNPLQVLIRRYLPDEHQRLVKQLKLNNVTLVYDIGANNGQFAGQLIEAGYKGKIVSFEPLSYAHELLTQKAKKECDWTVAPRAAVGSKVGKIAINISRNSFSSSLLPLTETGLAHAPNAVYVSQEETEVITLDSTNYDSALDNVFIKVDVQGYEFEVLKGATHLLAKAKGVQLEMSFLPIYAGAPKFEDLYMFMMEQGFSVWGMDPAFHDPKSYRLFQVDVTFFRTS